MEIKTTYTKSEVDFIFDHFVKLKKNGIPAKLVLKKAGLTQKVIINYKKGNNLDLRTIIKVKKAIKDTCEFYDIPCGIVD